MMAANMDSEALTRPFDLIGGAANTRALVDHFYDRMEQDPAFAKIRNMHPANLERSREKLYMFLSGWLGGPQLYIERFGHPRLRRRHLPFPIDEQARDQWLACMNHALLRTGVPDELAEMLRRQFAQVADFMRNVPEGESSPTK